MGFAVRNPGGLVVAGAVLEHEQRISFAGFVVARGRVNGEFAEPAQRLGTIRVLADGAVRDILEIPDQRLVAQHMQNARARLAHRFDPGVRGVNHRDAIHIETVFPNAGIDRANGHGPDIVGALGHGGAAIFPLALHGDFRGFRSADAEGDFAVRLNHRREHGRILGTTRGGGGGVGLRGES